MQIDATGISLLGSTQLQVLPLTQTIISAMTHNAKQMQCFFDEDPTPAETAAKQPTLHDENRDDVPATQSAKKSQRCGYLLNISNIPNRCILPVVVEE